MYLNFVLENFEIIVISILLIVTISTICILFIQNNFIKNTSNKIENYNDMIKKKLYRPELKDLYFLYKIITLNKRIINLADPTASQDAVTKNYLETTFLTPTNKSDITTAVNNKINPVMLSGCKSPFRSRI